MLGLSEFDRHVRTQAPVVHKLDISIHWINLHPLDIAIVFLNVYSLDSDLPGR